MIAGEVPYKVEQCPIQNPEKVSLS